MEQIIKNLTNKQSGFTLVELVVVVAVVGVLAVVATPKIIGVATDARTASLTGVASALTSASARNYAIRSANTNSGVIIESCSDITKALEDEALPSGYAFGGEIVGSAEVAAVTQTMVDANPDDGITETSPKIEAVTGVKSDGATAVAVGVRVGCTIQTETAPAVVAVFKVTGIL